MKSLLGRQYDDPAVQEFNNQRLGWSRDAFEDHKTGGVHLLPESQCETDNWEEMGGYRSSQTWRPEELSSLILSKMRKMAETHLGSLVKDVVLTVPPDFTIAQRLATREAGLLAGLNVVGILLEPVAAAIAYGLDKKEEEDTEGHILIFSSIRILHQEQDLDVSILGSENNILRVKSSAVGKGNTILDTVERAMKEAEASKNSITDIVLVGDLTGIQEVTKILEDFFPGSQLHTSINPREVVATGAAIVAARLNPGNTKVVSEKDGKSVSVQVLAAQDQRDGGTVSPPSSPSKKKQKLTV